MFWLLQAGIQLETEQYAGCGESSVGKRTHSASRSSHALSCLACLACALLTQHVRGQFLDEDFPPLCMHDEQDVGAVRSTAAGNVSPNSWYLIAESALVIEYESVYSVHTPFNPAIPIRSQPGSFFTEQILGDLECFVDSIGYDFVLLFSVPEVPGWIHSGPRGIPAPAKNIGLPNSQYGLPSAFPAWPRLLLAPHMNSIDFITQLKSPDYGIQIAMHEMGHAWGVFWAMDSPGPRDWKQGDPVAWLGSCCAHWSWNWVGEELPGMMYSAPTHPAFNDFDLYAMGLLSYAQAQPAVYTIFEVVGTSAPGPEHELSLDDLLYSLSLRGAPYFEGDGRRVPDLDPNFAELMALIVVVKGTGETISPAQEAAIIHLAEFLPDAWFAATGNRSTLKVSVTRSTPIDEDDDTILDCVDNCPTAENSTQADIDEDGLGDACDPCPHVSHPTLWDLDHRQGFDLHDFWVFQACFSGSFPVSPNCSFVDFSGGGKVDLSDYVPVGELMTGNCE